MKKLEKVNDSLYKSYTTINFLGKSINLKINIKSDNKYPSNIQLNRFKYIDVFFKNKNNQGKIKKALSKYGTKDTSKDLNILDIFKPKYLYIDISSSCFLILKYLKENEVNLALNLDTFIIENEEKVV